MLSCNYGKTLVYDWDWCNPTNPATAFEEPMKNVEMHVEGNILTIQILSLIHISEPTRPY